MDRDSKIQQRKNSELVHDDSTLPKPIRFRHNSILAVDRNWKFMASELSFVLLSGFVCWGIHLLSLFI